MPPPSGHQIRVGKTKAAPDRGYEEKIEAKLMALHRNNEVSRRPDNLLPAKSYLSGN